MALEFKIKSSIFLNEEEIRGIGFINIDEIIKDSQDPIQTIHFIMEELSYKFETEAKYDEDTEVFTITIIKRIG